MPPADLTEFDPERVLADVRGADTEDLLDRITVYREAYEPQAVRIIEDELRRRGVRSDEIGSHARRHADVLRGPDGMVLQCDFCRRPAVEVATEWHRVWKVVPLFRRVYRYCELHRPGGRPWKPGGPDRAAGPHS